MATTEIVESMHTYTIQTEQFRSGVFRVAGTYPGAFPAELAEIALQHFNDIPTTGVLVVHEGTGNRMRVNATQPVNQLSSMIDALPWYDAVTRPRLG